MDEATAAVIHCWVPDRALEPWKEGGLPLNTLVMATIHEVGGGPKGLPILTNVRRLESDD